MGLTVDDLLAREEITDVIKDLARGTDRLDRETDREHEADQRAVDREVARGVHEALRGGVVVAPLRDLADHVGERGLGASRGRGRYCSRRHGASLSTIRQRPRISGEDFRGRARSGRSRMRRPPDRARTPRRRARANGCGSARAPAPRRRTAGSAYIFDFSMTAAAITTWRRPPRVSSWKTSPSRRE